MTEDTPMTARQARVWAILTILCVAVACGLALVTGQWTLTSTVAMVAAAACAAALGLTLSRARS